MNMSTRTEMLAAATVSVPPFTSNRPAPEMSAPLLKVCVPEPIPYDEPTDAEVVIDTLAFTPEEAAQDIFLRLEKEGYIGAEE